MASDLSLFRAQSYVAGCFSLLSSSPLQGCAESPNTTQGRPLQSAAASVSGALFLLLVIVVLPLTYTDGKLIAVGRLVRYVLSGQQVIWLNVGMASLPKELLVFPGVELG